MVEGRDGRSGWPGAVGKSVQIDGLIRGGPVARLTFLGLVMVSTAGCPGEAVRPDSRGPGVPETTGVRKTLSFRSQELPFRYERGDTGAAWPSETTGGGVGLLDYD